MTNTSPPTWKQLLGAGTGALVALSIYGVYEGVVPSFEAYLVPRETISKNTLANRRYVPPQTQERFDRIASKTRAMVERLDEEHNLNVLKERLMRIVPEEPKTAEAASSILSTKEERVEPAEGIDSTVETPTLPQSGVAISFGILAACAGGVISLWRRKNRT